MLHLHKVLKKRKYRMLFSRPGARRPGPKGPNKELIDAVVAMKRWNPRWGCPRIAQQTSLAFGVDIDKDGVRRILSAPYRPESDAAGPSRLTFIGHAKDSLWSCDLFRCESAMLRTYWVLAVMDQFTRRILGFGVQPPTPAWGSMLSESRDFLYVAWWLAAFPGAALALTALGINLLGDWLRDVLDPKLRV